MTPHLNAKKSDIAKTVLMPGDPLRAKYIAETFLEDYKLVNNVRGMLAYTGKYKGTKVTIMGSGMGNPSMGIYSYELFKFYNVENIIRIGTCRSFSNKIGLGKIIVLEQTFSKSSYAFEVGLKLESQYMNASNYLLSEMKSLVKEKKIKATFGLGVSSAAFYKGEEYQSIVEEKIRTENLIAAEMEAFALYTNAQLLNKKALVVLTVSDAPNNKKQFTPKERETKVNDMVQLALDLVFEISN